MTNFNDLQQRLITGVIFGAVVIGAGFSGIAVFSILFCFLMIIVAYEWAKLCNANEVNAKIYAGAFFVFFTLFAKFPYIYLVSVIVCPVLIASHLKWNNDKLGLVTGFVYLSIAITYLFYLLGKFGWFAVFAIWISVIAVDVGAYIVGRIIGGRKLAPSISPGKTISGFVGGVLFGCVVFVCVIFVGATFEYIAINPNVVNNVFVIQLIGVMLGIMAQLGDLYQSFMKRRVGVKDSGKILPGHGGMFDRLDGLIMVLVFMNITYLAYKVIVG